MNAGNYYGNGHLRPPPFPGNAPPAYYQPGCYRGGGCSCMRCICCCYCVIFSIILSLIITFLILYMTYKPAELTHSIDTLFVKQFDLKEGSNLETEIMAGMKAKNPNERFTVKYGDKVRISVSYKDRELCSTALSGFTLPVKNSKKLEPDMKGITTMDSELQQDMMHHQTTGKVPLTVKLKSPIDYSLDDASIGKMPLLVTCLVVVDHLKAMEETKILLSHCRNHYPENQRLDN